MLKKVGSFKNMEKCIAAIATPNAPGGLSVIRLSGEGSFEIADKVFKSISGKKLCDLKGYSAAYGEFVYEGDEVIDDGVALVFRAPKSYTGEDVVEFSCHGGVLVTQKLLKALFSLGAAPAQRGEFTKRALLNGKMSLTQAEGIADLISAQSEMAVQSANAAKKGALFHKIKGICETLTAVDGHLQAWIDYPEEEIDDVLTEDILVKLNQVKSELKSLLDNYDNGKLIKQGISAVILGKPNVGKSTLMNLLSGYEKSIVTDIAGTTRDIVEETISLDGVSISLYDTAGICSTEDIVEKIGVDRAIEKISEVDFALAVFDSSRPFEDEDLEILNKIEGVPSIAILNKSDKGKMNISLHEHIFDYVVTTSNENMESIQNLKETILKVCKLNDFDASAPMIANERQRISANDAYGQICTVVDDLEFGMSWDAIGVGLDCAIDSLLSLTGEKATDTVVDEVFSHFCVGK